MTPEQRDALNDIKAAAGRFLAAFRGTKGMATPVKVVDALYRSLPDVNPRPLVLIKGSDRPEVRTLRESMAAHYTSNGKGA